MMPRFPLGLRREDMRSFISLCRIIITGGQHTLDQTHTHTHIERERGGVLPGNSADIICSELIYAKPIPFPSVVVFIVASNVSCPWVSPLPVNVHTYPMIMFIHINTELYVSYLQTDSLNEEGEQRPCRLMEYS